MFLLHVSLEIHSKRKFAGTDCARVKSWQIFTFFLRHPLLSFQFLAAYWPVPQHSSSSLNNNPTLFAPPYPSSSLKSDHGAGDVSTPIHCHSHLIAIPLVCCQASPAFALPSTFPACYQLSLCIAFPLTTLILAQESRFCASSYHMEGSTPTSLKSR